MLCGAPGPANTAADPLAGAVLCSGHQSRLCCSLKPLFLLKSAPAVEVGRWCCQATGGEGPGGAGLGGPHWRGAARASPGARWGTRKRGPG